MITKYQYVFQPNMPMKINCLYETSEDLKPFLEKKVLPLIDPGKVNSYFGGGNHR